MHDPNLRRLLGVFSFALWGSCGGSAGSLAVPPPSNAPTANGLGSYFLSTPHHGGATDDLRITGLQWGRLVDVFETTGDAQQPVRLVFHDLLIDPSITQSTLDFEFSANPVSGKEFVVVRYASTSLEFLGVLSELTDTQPVPPKGLGGNVLPPFTAISRNAALAIDFNDLIDAATITPKNVQVLAGDPPSLPFEARIVPSATHGALQGGTFHSTRVIVDFTVSTLESLASPGLAVQTLGLPAAQQVHAPNAALRIPTRTGPGQFTVLANLSGNELDFTSAGPVDASSPTLDVVRAFRSQGKSEVTGDPHNGFLPDEIPPAVLGTQGVFAQQNVPGDPALLDVTFLTPACTLPLRTGDVLEFAGFVFQVVAPGQLAGDAVVGARVLALVGDLAAFGPSFGVLKTTWDPELGAPPECFVRFEPQPETLPASGVSTAVTVVAQFSEPMDPANVQALESFRVTYEDPPVTGNPMFANVVGRILPAADLESFVFAPSLPLRHASGASETYFVEIGADDPATGATDGVTDLAGNPLVFGLPPAAFTIAAGEPSRTTAGYALRFVDPLGDEDGNGKPDLRGQFVIDPRQVVQPRALQRFSVLLDDNQPLIGIMSATPGPVQTPLSDKGSKAQLTWRYIDMGFGLLDDLFHNLDVEGTNWVPFTPNVASDHFTNFSISMTHAAFFPDDTRNTGLLPAYPSSGLVETFAGNLLDPIHIQPTTMTPIASSYSVSSTDAFPASQSAQTLLVPWPINRNVPVGQFTYWTWRDTSLIQVAGHDSGLGVDPMVLQQATGAAGLPGFYPATQIPTIGLPMLTEYRTNPDPGAFALNGFKTSFALASSSLPAFRAFSTGGNDQNGIPQLIQPGNELIAQGGYTLAGVKTPGIDNTMYWGQADFVVRVSRFHTVWYDSTAAGVQYAAGVIEPVSSEQPSGTTVSVAFRGASDLAVPLGSSTPPEWTDAARMDPYGDPYTQAQLGMLQDPGAKAFTVAHFPDATDKSWRNSATELDGARYLQMRVTLTGNAESGLTPEVSAIGVAYTLP